MISNNRIDDLFGVNDNSNFAVRFTFDIGNTNASGNNRYDNITLDAAPL